MEALVRVEDLSKSFPLRKEGLFRRSRINVAAVDRIGFEISKGETFGVVGESGSGKTTLARLMLGLEKPTSGRIFCFGRDITTLPDQEMKKLRLRMQMIFQDPYSSLDPRHNILKVVAEPLKVHRLCREPEAEALVARALEMVDLPATAEFMDKMPDELSGGQRQRVGIARALVTGAEFIIGDEPVSMLDANVKAGIVALLSDLKRRADLTYMFITHEIGLAYHICDRIAVMYLGRIVETGPAESLIRRPLHPYTKMLMAAIPPLMPDPNWAQHIREGGESMAPSADNAGCRFRTRCPQSGVTCETVEPILRPVEKDRFVACHDHPTRLESGRP
jgi:oligopeptide/dipeptide ABC transporter ATP-binding protein